MTDGAESARSGATDEDTAELEELLLGTGSVEAYLADFASRAADRIMPGTECSITARLRGDDRRVASSDERSARCDQAEISAGAGPCITAIDETRVLAGSEVWTDPRWPEWRATATEVGFRSAAAVPADAGPDAHIALNLYHDEAELWDGDAMARAEGYTQEIARVVALCLRIAEQMVLNEDLSAAMASRSVIDQAIGVVMAQNRCSAEEAFRILRSASSHRNVKLREVAAAIVRSVTGAEPSPGTFRPRSSG
jgi:hypothetical protein